MSRFVESIHIENGCIYQLPYHEARLNTTRKEVLGCIEVIDLNRFIHPIPYLERTKCRIEYDKEIRRIEYIPYQFRPVATLRLVTDNTIDYHYKTTDRSKLNVLFAQRGNCDDILIVRNGLLTDTFTCNLALWDGKEWLTPAKPLLPGTTRAALLDQDLIRITDIKATELYLFKKIRLFNAMIGFGEIELDIDRVWG